MTKPELAASFQADFAALHGFIDELPEGQTKRKAKRLANLSHGAIDALKELAVDDGQIEPMSGGEPKEF